ncbi:hypothetical protein CRUP_032537, partial [Coryphaenoides rupestris]
MSLCSPSSSSTDRRTGASNMPNDKPAPRFSTGWMAVTLSLGVIGVFFFCEYLIYFPVVLSSATVRDADRQREEEEEERAPKPSAPWEWQMERGFQTALWLLRPEIVFILGDIFDEGKWSTPTNWDDDVRRFHRMFRHSSDTQLVVLVGNHDI